MQRKDMKSLMDAYNQVIQGGEALAIDEARQMKDPKKDSMVVKGGKTIVIDKDKEKEYLKKGWKLAEKKKLDPVDDAENDKKFKDRKDKDIDNDGDVDSSDEYLHKKRKATDDAIDGGKKPADNAKKEEDEEEGGDEEEKEAPKVAGKKDDKKKVASNAKTAEISKIGEATEALLDMFENILGERKETAGATKPEGIMDKESPKSKEFAKAHDKSDKKIEDNEEDGHDKTFKAQGGTKPKSGKRPQDNATGDTKVVKSTEVKEEVELEEGLKTTHVVVDTAQGNKIVSTAAGSNAEKNLRSSIASAEKPPMNIKDKKTLKIVQLKKPTNKDLVGTTLKEESAEDVVAQAQDIINGKTVSEIADLTSDKPVNKYDGRTREAKEFLKRMAKRQGKKIDSGYKGGY